MPIRGEGERCEWEAGEVRMVNGGKLFMMGRSMSASIWWSGNKGGFGVRFTARVRAWA